MSPFKTLLLVITLILLALGSAIGLYSLLGSDRGSGKLDIIPVTIEHLRLSIPRQFFRSGYSAPGSASERADLILLFPEMIAAGQPPDKAADAPDPRLLVFASIQRNDGVIDPAERVQDLYGRFLESTTFDNPGGLLMKRFIADSPYADEELFIAPPDGRIFSARCRKPEKPASAQAPKSEGTSQIGEACLWRFRQSGADIHIRFSPELLPHWEEMATGIGTRLKEWETR
jgi:hypothetical protein